MACVETAIEYLKMFTQHKQRQGFAPNEASQVTGIVVDSEGNLVPYMVCESHRSYKRALGELAKGAKAEDVPFIFVRISPCAECVTNIKARTHLHEGIPHFELAFDQTPPVCRHN